MLYTERTIEPDSGRHEEYRSYVDRYVETYLQMRPLRHKTVRHVASGGAAVAAGGVGHDRGW